LLILLRRTLLILLRRALLILLRRALLLRRTLLILLVRISLLLVLLVWRALLVSPLLRAFAHLRAVCAPFLPELILLIGRELAHQLLAQLSDGVAIARAAFRMRLRILVNKRLNVLLLIARKVEVAETAPPALLEPRFARHLTGRTRCGSLALRGSLLGRRCQRHRERRGERARRQEVEFHGFDLIPARPQAPERRIRT
jgi:hypothetical protein